MGDGQRGWESGVGGTHVKLELCIPDDQRRCWQAVEVRDGPVGLGRRAELRPHRRHRAGQGRPHMGPLLLGATAMRASESCRVVRCAPAAHACIRRRVVVRALDPTVGSVATRQRTDAPAVTSSHLDRHTQARPPPQSKLQLRQASGRNPLVIGGVRAVGRAPRGYPARLSSGRTAAPATEPMRAHW